MSTKSQGSWFPSGYYGHFRSRSRNDFVNSYRQEAKPSPPMKFAKKLTARPTMHQFSHHDNRFSFLNTVTSFQDGLGKKKVPSAHMGKFAADFIAWVPHSKELKEAGPNVSVYRETFRPSVETRVPQIIVPTVYKPKSKCQSVLAPVALTLSSPYCDPAETTTEAPMTTYRLTHQHQQPNPKVQTNMNTGVVQENPVLYQKSNTYINPKVDSIYNRPKHQSSLTSLRRARIGSAPVYRSSVADCLSWHIPKVETIDLKLEEQRPKSVAGTFPDLTISTAANPPCANQTNSDSSLHQIAPATVGIGTTCPTTSWGKQTQLNSNLRSGDMETGPTLEMSAAAE